MRLWPENSFRNMATRAMTPMMTNFFAANPASGFSQTNTSIKRFGINDAFLVELAPNGTNVFSAYLGGSGNDQANGIALDQTTGTNVIAYIVGTSTSTRGAVWVTFCSGLPVWPTSGVAAT